MTLTTLSDDQKLTPHSIDTVRKSQGVQVNYFRKLLVHLAQLRRANPGHLILLRGQSQDYRNEAGETLIVPTAFRSGLDESSKNLRLKSAQESLRDEAKNQNVTEQSRNDLSDPFAAQIVLQHYHSEAAVDTPWIDLTDSPQMAVYFATCRNWTQATLYAFAIPRERVFLGVDRITEGCVCFCLGCFCPVDALRPHFQSAYALAWIEDVVRAKAPQLAGFRNELSQHLLCKFQIVPSTVCAEMHSTFGMPVGHAIYPRESEDKMKGVCQAVSAKLAR